MKFTDQSQRIQPYVCLSGPPTTYRTRITLYDTGYFLFRSKYRRKLSQSLQTAAILFPVIFILFNPSLTHGLKY
jgi:hypothetical protein